MRNEGEEGFEGSEATLGRPTPPCAAVYCLDGEHAGGGRGKTKMMMKIGGGRLPTEEKGVYIYIYILKWFRVSYRENHH